MSLLMTTTQGSDQEIASTIASTYDFCISLLLKPTRTLKAMATITFTLRDPQSKGETPINLTFRYNGGKRLRAAIGMKVKPTDWIIAKGEYRQTIEDYAKYNRKLSALKKTMQGVYADMHAAFLEDKSNLKPDNANLLKAFKEQQSGTSKVTLADYFQDRIDKALSGEILTKAQTKFSPNTVKDIKTSLAQLEAYQDHTEKVFDFNDINMNWYRGFTEFLQDKNYRANSIGKHFKNLKWVMASAKKQKLHSNEAYLDSDFKVVEVEVQNIYLNTKEIEAIYNLRLDHEPHLSRIRDLFLIGYYTMQRFSDYSRINSSMLYTMPDGKKGLRINTQKTGQTMFLPFWGHLDEILSRYNFNVPVIPEQVLNREIKNICLDAGIDDPFHKEEIRGGVRVSKKYLKCELVTSHTARRSGASNAFLAGVPAMFIKMLTGHKTDANFLKYINVSQEEAVAKMIEHPFFQEGNLKVV